MGTPANTRIIPHLSPSKPLPLKPVANGNVHHVVLGDLLFKSWYPSYYPEELLGKEVEKLYVCPWCFKYSNDIIPFVGHVVCGFFLSVLGYNMLIDLTLRTEAMF